MLKLSLFLCARVLMVSIKNPLLNLSNYLLLIVLAYFIVQFFWLLLPKQDNASLGLSPIKSQVKTKMPKALALFGELAKKEAPTPKKSTLTKTKLNLVLHGIWLNSKDPKKSYVIVELSGQDKIYHLNDSISSLATIEDIQENFITLNRSGTMEALYLRKNNNNVRFDEAPATTKETRTFKPRLNSIEKRKLNKIRRELKTNPWKLAQIMNIAPHYRSGKLIGFKVQPGRERHLFYQLGLESGDVVYQVNGSALSFSQLNTVLNTVVSNGNISIDFYRNGTEHSLTLNL